MSSDDDITERILGEDPYDEAELTVQSTFPLTLDQRILLAIGTLAYAGAFWPALVFSRDFITSIDPAQGTETASPALTWMVVIGLVSAFTAGLLLVGVRHKLASGSPDIDRARRLVRIEDFFTLFVVYGSLFVGVPTTLAVVGVAAPGVIESLYSNSLRLYRPGGPGIVGPTYVSAAGAVLAATLGVLRWVVAE